MLKDCVDAWVEKCIREESGSEIVNDYEKSKVAKALREQATRRIKEEIKGELTSDEIQKIKRTAQAKADKWKQKQRFRQLLTLLAEGVFVAVLVGLLVNQVTDIISYLKGDAAYFTTAIILVILLILLVLFIILRLIAYFRTEDETPEEV